MVAMTYIKGLADRIAAEFHPQRIILYGSYAHGQPTPDSDVDLLVVMPYEGHPARVAADILLRTDPSFPVDILVRSPQETRHRYRMGDTFMCEVLDRGKVVYEG